MTPFSRRRLRFVCEEPLKYGANAAAQFDDPKWPRFVRITDITESGELKEGTFRSLPPELAHGYLLEEGDILLARSGSVGRSFIYEPEWGEACFAGYLVRARTSDSFDPRFVYWSLNTLDYWSWIESIAIRSTIHNVSAERYAEYAVPAPPLDTQRRIVRFLDDKTARIDVLIAKKWELLDRLVEKRRALITRTVTRGLSSEASAKPSDVRGQNQLGASDSEAADELVELPEGVRQVYRELPSDWKVAKLKFVADIKNSNVDKAIAEDEKSVRLCNYTDVYYNERITSDLQFMRGSATRSEIDHFQLRRGQVIITKDSEAWDDIGIPALVTEDMPEVLCGYHLSMIDPSAELDGGFLAWLCRAAPLNDQFKLAANGVTRFGLGQYSMKNAVVVLPPLDTQRKVVHFLDESVGQIDMLKERIYDSIELLKEYRRAQISAAVTGELTELW